MSEVFKKISGVQPMTLSSDLPDKIIATCLSATQSEKKGAYAGAPTLKLELITDDKITFSISYRIPKALTGKGQLDLFIAQMAKLKLKPEEIVGKRAEWVRMELDGGVTGNPRFYPTKILGQKAL